MLQECNTTKGGKLHQMQARQGPGPWHTFSHVGFAMDGHLSVRPTSSWILFVFDTSTPFRLSVGLHFIWLLPQGSIRKSRTHLCYLNDHCRYLQVLITPSPMIIIALRRYHKSSFITSTPIFVRSPIRHRLLAQSFAPVTTSRDFSRTTNSFPILDNILSFITHCISPFLHPLSFHYICGHFVYRKQHYKY